MARIESIPLLEATILDAQRHDPEHQTFAAELRAIEDGVTRRFQLRCTGVRAVRHRVERPAREPWEYIEVTEVYREPHPAGGLLVTLELWNDAEWIEIECAGLDVRESPAANGSPAT